MRFSQEMQKISLHLELHCGFAVFQCVYNQDNISLTEKDLEALKLAHRKKISLSDAIYVLDIDNYIGNSVQYEISYAKSLGKEIIYHTKFVNKPLR